MPNNPRRDLNIAGTNNIRDLGGYRTQDGHLTQWRRVLRGDGLHQIAPAGSEALRQVGLRSVIDLRSNQELVDEPNPFALTDGVDFNPRPLFDDLAPTMKGIKLRDPQDVLLDFYIQALTEHAPRVKAVMETIANAPDGPVLFHCTAGKDRTGIIAALLLGTAGVSRQDIVADYTLTGSRIAPLVDALLARTAAHGGDVEGHARFLRCDPPTMEATLDHLNSRHGSIPGYLSDIGLSAGDIANLRDRLLAS